MMGGATMLGHLSDARSAALVVRYPYRTLVVAVARSLAERFGTRLYIYCERKDQLAYFERELAAFSPHLAVVPDSRNVPPAAECDAVALTATAGAFEKRAGERLNTLIMADRNWCFGYALGGMGGVMPSGFWDAGYFQVLARICRNLEFWEREIQDHALGLFLVFAGPGAAKETAVAARIRGVPYRVISTSRHKNLHSWFCDEHYRSNLLKTRYEAIPAAAVQAEAVDGYTEYLIARRVYLGNLGRPGRMARDFARTAIKQLRLRLSPRGRPRYGVAEMLRASLRPHLDYRAQVRTVGRAPNALKTAMDYVFYPLQLEPEPALTQLSPEYFDQIGAIAQISRDLPAGVFLVVKEHLSAFGRRPAGFYRQIRAIKNVILADPRLPGVDLVRNARAVATINSTAGFEAAVMGVPVLTWGRHNMYNFLPHVRVIEAAGSAIEDVDWALSHGRDEAARQSGARFLQAIVDISFDLGPFDVLSMSDIPADAIDACLDVLARTLPGNGLH